MLASNGRWFDPSSGFSEQEQRARARRAWQLRRENNELLDRQWSEPPPEPTNQVDVGQILDQEYAKHQRINRGWTGMIFDPDPVDNSLPRDQWDDRVQDFLRNPVKPPGATIARDPHALAGHDAVMGVRSALVKALDGNITNRGVAERIKGHYGARPEE